MKIKILWITFLFMFATTHFAVCAEDEGVDEAITEEKIVENTYLKTPESKIRRKFARGVANMLTAPYEIPVGIKNVSASEGLKIGWSSGLTQGIVMMLGRLLTGAYEVLTFPLPYPNDYEPIIQPEFTWQVQGPYGEA